MAFENYFEKEVLAPAVDIGSESRKFQRSIKFIKQDRYKSGVLFYLGQIHLLKEIVLQPPPIHNNHLRRLLK